MKCLSKCIKSFFSIFFFFKICDCLPCLNFSDPLLETLISLFGLSDYAMVSLFKLIDRGLKSSWPPPPPPPHTHTHTPRCLEKSNKHCCNYLGRLRNYLCNLNQYIIKYWFFYLGKKFKIMNIHSKNFRKNIPLFKHFRVFFIVYMTQCYI